MVPDGRLHAEWLAALSDAKIAADRTHLFPWPGEGPNAAAAMWYPPGRILQTDEQFPDPAQTALANTPAVRNLHRVSVWPDALSAAELAAVLRHELEHALQWDRLDLTSTRLYDLAKCLLTYKAGELDGCAGSLINTIPFEEDCNAAASAHVWARYPDEAKAMCRGDRRHLACSRVGPQPFDTLPARTVAWMYAHSDLVTAYVADKNVDFRSALDARAKGTGSLWAAIVDAGNVYTGSAE
jgi:hypothetical protein